jgi:excisionase family DNA binding protein
MKKNKSEAYWTVGEIAEHLNVSARTVWRWIANRKLIDHRIGGVVRISPEDLAVFLSARRRILASTASKKTPLNKG